MVVMFVIVVFVVKGTFRTIPTVESYGVLRGFSTITGLGKLLSCRQLNSLTAIGAHESPLFDKLLW
jgi:hypothetical protein